MSKIRFAVFVMVYGRPERMWTVDSLRRSGYTGDIYFVGDNTDKTIDGYKAKYGDRLIVFDKHEAAKTIDAGDNSGDLRSTVYAANTIPSIAKDMGLTHFAIMCDDYTMFNVNFDGEYRYYISPVRAKNLDGVFLAMAEFLDSTKSKTIALSQGGDFIGGWRSTLAKPTLLRKAMNSFLCSVDNPIKFMGRLNEDVTTYVNLGNKGDLFFTLTNVALKQKPTQSQKGGLTETYLDTGTYVKSFFSVMYNPSCVKVSMMGASHKRIHHHVLWRNAVPCIIPESFRKA